MVMLLLALGGLCFGSLANVLVVWQSNLVGQSRNHINKKNSKNDKSAQNTSYKNHFVCLSCRHASNLMETLPIIGWVSSRGRCRYCNAPLSKLPIFIELIVSVLVVVSYYAWPDAVMATRGLLRPFVGSFWPGSALFITWVFILCLFAATIISDLRFKQIPKFILYLLSSFIIIYGLINTIYAAVPGIALLNILMSVVVSGGIFYFLFRQSKGTLVSYQEAKIAALFGLLLGTPGRSLLFVLVTLIVGSITAIMLIIIKNAPKHTVLPLVPIIIASATIVQLVGSNFLHWYQSVFIKF